MSKNLPPPMKMKVERGRLVPASTYDAERLDSYRVGSTVNVRFTADRMRPLERKYRAILGKVIKECATPWTNAEAAHQALKLACGYVNVGKTASGQFMQWPRSIAEFDDQEMTDYYESVLAILSRITRVDVETLRNETANVGDDEEPHDPVTGEIIEHEPGDAPVPPVADEGSLMPSSAEPADSVPQSAGSSIPDATGTPVADLASGDDPAGGETTPSLPPAGSNLIDCAREMLSLTTMSYSDDEERTAAIGQCADEWKVKLPGDQKKIDSILIAANAVATKNRTLIQARSFLAGVLDCSAEDLESANG